MHFGYAQAAITPDLQNIVYLAGFESNKPAQAVHDDLWARAIALQTEEMSLVLVTLDLIGLPRLICQAIEESVQEKVSSPVKLLIVCSHTHFGPDTIGLWGPSHTESGIDSEYISRLKKYIQNVALDALNMVSKPLHSIKSIEVKIPNIVKNARNSHILDEEATALQFWGKENILATCIIYPCHPEVLEPRMTDISSDYVHTLRTTIEADTGSPALFMPGALGGMMTPDMPGRTHNHAADMGSIIADTVLATLANAEKSVLKQFCYERQMIAVDFDSPMLEQAIEIGLVEQGEINTDGHLVTEINFLQFNKTMLITNPGELLPELGLELKHYMKASGANVAGVISLANDELGYILPEKDFVYPENPLEPGDHYEETVSVGPKIGTILMTSSKELINNLAHE